MRGCRAAPARRGAGRLPCPDTRGSSLCGSVLDRGRFGVRRALVPGLVPARIERGHAGPIQAQRVAAVELPWHFFVLLMVGMRGVARLEDFAGERLDRRGREYVREFGDVRAAVYSTQPPL